MNITLGKCDKCLMAFAWKSGRGRRLAETRCPNCGGGLSRTSTALRTHQWFAIDLAVNRKWPALYPLFEKGKTPAS